MFKWLSFCWTCTNQGIRKLALILSSCILYPLMHQSCQSFPVEWFTTHRGHSTRFCEECTQNGERFGWAGIMKSWHLLMSISVVSLGCSRWSHLVLILLLITLNFEPLPSNSYPATYIKQCVGVLILNEIYTWVNFFQ